MLNRKVHLLHGNCLEEMKRIPDGYVDMILCDLPYGTTDCIWDEVIPFGPLWEQYLRVIRHNGAIVLFSAQPFTTKIINSCPEFFRYEIIWDKVNLATGYGNAKLMPMRRHENILVFYRALPVYRPQMTSGKPYSSKGDGKKAEVYANGGLIKRDTVNHGTRYPTTVLSIPASGGEKRGQHPTQKPVAVCEWLINSYTFEGQTVLDNTMGSGSTGVACIRTRRRFIGIEQDGIHFNTAKTRIYQEQRLRLVPKVYKKLKIK